MEVNLVGDAAATVRALLPRLEPHTTAKGEMDSAVHEFELGEAGVESGIN